MTLQIVASLIDNAIVIIYDRNMFTIQAAGFKYLLGTNTLAYFGQVSWRNKKSFIALAVKLEGRGGREEKF